MGTAAATLMSCVLLWVVGCSSSEPRPGPADTGVSLDADAVVARDADAVEARDADAVEARDASVDGGASCFTPEGREIPAGTVFAAGNGAYCRCETAGFGFGCTNGRCEPACFEAPDGGTTRCMSGSECASGTCLFDPGCTGEPGYCVVGSTACQVGVGQPPGPPVADAGVEFFNFCGCDGVTYHGPCVTVPYRHTGNCR
jgi:hypothetical protein